MELVNRPLKTSAYSRGGSRFTDNKLSYQIADKTLFPLKTGMEYVNVFQLISYTLSFHEEFNSAVSDA